jgi:aminopeptidase N
MEDMKRNTNQLHSFLQTSIDQYSDILELMQSITQTHKNLSVEELTTIGQQILRKQKTAAETDKNLLALLAEASAAMIDDTAIAKRTELIKHVIQLNTIITPKLTNIKSLMGSELQQVKKGRSAIKGYQQTETRHGRNLNNTL